MPPVIVIASTRQIIIDAISGYDPINKSVPFLFRRLKTRYKAEKKIRNPNTGIL